MFTGTDCDWVTLGRRTRGTGQVWSDCDLSVMTDGLFMVISTSESTENCVMNSGENYLKY